ncbi:MAG: hypothetical protein JOZ33_07530 [Acidobacteriaceae bacterium]|nr:hypothetical protein [Acidobacteriaceae bacterium]
MTNSMNTKSAARKLGYGGVLAVTLLAALAPAFSQSNGKPAIIDATAMGTSTQLGANVSIKVTINRFSTEEERQQLIAAFKKGQSQGLVDALSKMQPVGRIAITGTLGYDLAYVRLIRTPTGRTIRFATNRLIRFGEAYTNSQSMAYNLTAGEFELNNADKDKSSGVLFPACQLIINKKGELQFELRKNPWKLVNIIDWDKAGSEAQSGGGQ